MGQAVNDEDSNSGGAVVKHPCRRMGLGVVAPRCYPVSAETVVM